MAKKSAHGYEIGTVEFLTSAKVYMSDGAILKNIGFGWKRHGKCKPGISAEQAFAAAQSRHARFDDARPCLVAYRKELHEMAGLCKRWKLHAAVQLMPEDPDGVWSEACDGYGDNVSADVSEVSHLCELYLSAMEEMEELKDPTNAVAEA